MADTINSLIIIHISASRGVFQASPEVLNSSWVILSMWVVELGAMVLWKTVVMIKGLLGIMFCRHHRVENHVLVIHITMRGTTRSVFAMWDGASDGWDGASDGLGCSDRWFRSNDGMERRAMDGVEQARDGTEEQVMDGMKHVMDWMEQAMDGMEQAMV